MFDTAPLWPQVAQLAPLQQWIKARCGLQFEGQDAAKLVRAVYERSRAQDVPVDTYVERLLQGGAASDAQFQELVNLLTINETYFFRECEQLDLLVQRILPRWLVRTGGQTPIRILSAGCSTGEEPYSLAMALMEKYGDAMTRWFTLLGADIDSHALVKARAARYSDFSFRGVPEHIRQRYFARHSSGGWQLHSHVREQVDFHELNLLDAAAPAVLQQCDVILFRNVSIYFDTPTRRTIQQHLAQLLKGDGLLMIGTAETLANDLGVLSLVEESGLFYFTKGQPPLAPHSLAHPKPVGALGSAGTGGAAAARLSPPPVAPAPLTLPAGWQPHSSAPQSSPSPRGAGRVAAAGPSDVSAASADHQALLEQARQALQDKHYAAALALLDGLLAQQPQHAPAQLLKGYALLERKDFAGAQALGEQVLQQQPWSVDACVLLGLAAKWSEDSANALRWLRQAVYAEHACWPAHYYLADVLRSQGTPEALKQAQRCWRVVLQLLDAAPVAPQDAPDSALASAALARPATGLHHLPLELPAAQIRFLCTRYLSQSATSAALEDGA